MDEALAMLYWRDEALQILYWLLGEGLGDAVAPRDLQLFFGLSESEIRHYLDLLVADGYVCHVDSAPGRYRLTDLGRKEGGRRFADEFAGLTGQAHGECSDPDCACHTLGPEACTASTQVEQS